MKGFALMEVVISAGLIVLTSAFIFGLLNYCALNSERCSKNAVEVFRAQSRMESLRTVSFATLESAGDLIVTPIDPDTKSIELKSGSFSLYSVRSKY